eukprot:7036838-Prorocentrum_lima.AAC.1
MAAAVAGSAGPAAPMASAAGTDVRTTIPPPAAPMASAAGGEVLIKTTGWSRSISGILTVAFG